MIRFARVGVAFVLLVAGAGCTQETQNQIGRSIQNWTGTDGVLDVYAGHELVKRFVHIDKLSTALGTRDDAPRAYRYGYGVLDENQNLQADPGEKKVYFEVPDFATTSFTKAPADTSPDETGDEWPASLGNGHRSEESACRRTLRPRSA